MVKSKRKSKRKSKKRKSPRCWLVKFDGSPKSSRKKSPRKKSLRKKSPRKKRKSPRKKKKFMISFPERMYILQKAKRNPGGDRYPLPWRCPYCPGKNESGTNKCQKCKKYIPYDHYRQYMLSMAETPGFKNFLLHIQLLRKAGGLSKLTDAEVENQLSELLWRYKYRQLKIEQEARRRAKRKAKRQAKRNAKRKAKRKVYV